MYTCNWCKKLTLSRTHRKWDSTQHCYHLQWKHGNQTTFYSIPCYHGKNDIVNSLQHVQLWHGAQQQLNDDCWLTGVLELILMFACGLVDADAAGPTLAFISAAIVTNACSTFVAFFALVSRNGIRSWSAYSCTDHTHLTNCDIWIQVHEHN